VGKTSEDHATTLQVRKRSRVDDVKVAVMDQDFSPQANAGASGVFALVVMIEGVLKRIHVLHLGKKR